MVTASPEFFFDLMVFIFAGSVMGSFASAIICRIQQGESWILTKDISKNTKAARSQCPKCHHILRGKDLVPVLSWLWQRGRCRYCHETISMQYLVLELVSIFLAVNIYYFFGFSLLGFFLLALLPFALTQAILFYQSNIMSGQLCVIIGGIILLYSSLYLLGYQ